MKILVVDDNRFILELINSILDGDDYEIDAHACVDDALMAIDRDPEGYDLIITDIVMPIKNGVDFIKSLKEKKINTPILAITGGVENAVQDYVQYADLFADETLSKPFNKDMFLETVDRLGAVDRLH